MKVFPEGPSSLNRLVILSSSSDVFTSGPKSGTSGSLMCRTSYSRIRIKRVSFDDSVRHGTFPSRFPKEEVLDIHPLFQVGQDSLPVNTRVRRRRLGRNHTVTTIQLEVDGRHR